MKMHGRCTCTIFVMFYLLTSIGASESTLTENFDIVKKGKHCVEAAKAVVKATNKLDTDVALEHLNSLQPDRELLVHHAQSTLNQLEKTEGDSQNELDQTEREIGKLAQTEQDLKQEKARLEVTIQQQQQTLQVNEGKVTDKNRALQRAQDKLHDAKKDAQDNRKKGAIIGGLLGLVTGGLGTALAGGLAGTVGGEIINQIEGDIDDARRRLRDCERALTQAKRAVTETQNRINDLSNRISAIPEQIERKMSEHAMKHKQAANLRNDIIFQKKSTEFWKLLLMHTDNAGEQTLHLKKILEEATKTQDWDILRSDGTRIIHASFLEAWEEIEGAAKKNSSYYYKPVLDTTEVELNEAWRNGAIVGGLLGSLFTGGTCIGAALAGGIHNIIAGTVTAGFEIINRIMEWLQATVTALARRNLLVDIIIVIGGAVYKKRRAHGTVTPKVQIVGARKIWGTMRETSASAVTTTLTKLTSVNRDQIQVRRKFNSTDSNDIDRWWFVLKGDEEILLQLESEWENVRLQTKWELVPLLKFADNEPTTYHAY